MKILRIASLVFLISLMLFGFYLHTYMKTPVFFEEGARIVEIEKGMSLEDVLRKLEEKGVIDKPWLLKIYMEIMGLGKSVKAGEYSFYSGITPKEIVEKIVYGRVVLHKVTVREGDTILDIAERLVESGILGSKKSFIKICYSEKLVGLLGIEGPKNLEGYLFPETYFFEKGTPEEAIVRVMVERFKEMVFNKEFFEGCKRIGLTPHQVITLASMVEKETYIDEEKPIIAAVYLNRLRKGMRLQCDPTVRYATGNWDKRITVEELRFKNPYNTYVFKGLPPGPICSPGLSSIKAVLHPAKVDYLYFVAGRGGRHYFSRTFDEHRRKARYYRRRR